MNRINRNGYACTSRDINKTAAEQLDEPNMLMITGPVALPVIVMGMGVGMRCSGFVPCHTADPASAGGFPDHCAGWLMRMSTVPVRVRFRAVSVMLDQMMQPRTDTDKSREDQFGRQHQRHRQ